MAYILLLVLIASMGFDLHTCSRYITVPESTTGAPPRTNSFLVYGGTIQGNSQTTAQSPTNQTTTEANSRSVGTTEHVTQTTREPIIERFRGPKGTEQTNCEVTVRAFEMQNIIRRIEGHEKIEGDEIMYVGLRRSNGMQRRYFKAKVVQMGVVVNAKKGGFIRLENGKRYLLIPTIQLKNGCYVKKVKNKPIPSTIITRGDNFRFVSTFLKIENDGTKLISFDNLDFSEISGMNPIGITGLTIMNGFWRQAEIDDLDSLPDIVLETKHSSSYRSRRSTSSCLSPKTFGRWTAYGAWHISRNECNEAYLCNALLKKGCKGLEICPNYKSITFSQANCGYIAGSVTHPSGQLIKTCEQDGKWKAVKSKLAICLSSGSSNDAKKEYISQYDPNFDFNSYTNVSNIHRFYTRHNRFTNLTRKIQDHFERLNRSMISNSTLKKRWTLEREMQRELYVNQELQGMRAEIAANLEMIKTVKQLYSVLNKTVGRNETQRPQPISSKQICPIILTCNITTNIGSGFKPTKKPKTTTMPMNNSNNTNSTFSSNTTVPLNATAASPEDDDYMDGKWWIVWVALGALGSVSLFLCAIIAILRTRRGSMY